MQWSSIATAGLAVLAGCADGPVDPGSDPDPSLPWAVADCGLDTQNTGWEEGDVLPDFSLENQLGSQTHLHQFCDRTVLIQVTNYW